MTAHSSILAWEILQTDEPGGLQSMGLQKGRTWLRVNNKVSLPDNTKEKKVEIKLTYMFQYDIFCFLKFKK